MIDWIIGFKIALFLTWTSSYWSNKYIIGNINKYKTQINISQPFHWNCIQEYTGTVQAYKNLTVYDSYYNNE